jgi:hypothetical protein
MGMGGVSYIAVTKKDMVSLVDPHNSDGEACGAGK